MKSISYAALLIALMSTGAHAEAPIDTADAPEEVIVHGHKPDKPPTTTASTTADGIAKTVNVITPEDTLRYLPNILIRQRHIGDTQAPVTTRTSGVGASARSLIYVDGILLSSLIGNNNTSASPKWGLIQPDAVERVDVLYGPFSAAYPGNSLGSTIVFTTRMPEALQGSIDVQGASQVFKLYGEDKSYGTGRLAGDIGDRFGKFAFRLGVNYLDSQAQPLAYATATVPAANGTAGTAVVGAFNDSNRTGAAIKVLGATSIEHQTQDNWSGRATYDLSPSVTAAYTFGLFHNRDTAGVNSYLRDASSNMVYAGSINIDNKTYTIANNAFSSGLYRLDETQFAQALSLTSHSDGRFDYELTATAFSYLHSHQVSPSGALPNAFTGGAGTDAVLDGTRWTTLDAKSIWRPDSAQTLSIGAHQDAFHLKSVTDLMSDWRDGGDGALKTANLGRTRTSALWIQDAWKWSPTVTATFGGRWEDWRADRGVTYSASPALNVAQPALKASAFSPKAVIAWAPGAWTFKASMAEAYRFPTVSELYQAITTGPVLSVPNPNLRPERAVSAELSAERTWTGGNARLSLFSERIANALLSQSAPLVAGSNTLYSFVQNIDRTSARGAEIVAAQNLGKWQLSGWLTYVDARIVKDQAFAAGVGKQLPQLPKWRGAFTLAYAPSARWDIALAGRYSDRAFGTIDNSDGHANTFQGFSGYFVADLHVHYKVDKHVTADIGVDNLNDRRYFIYHPFPQRTFIVDLKYSL